MSAPAIGDVLDARYLLFREIARGAMGIVFEGRHVLTGRKVAVKTMSPELAGNRELRGRFQREARCLGAIDHPGVVQILDAGAVDEHPFLVLEMLEGRTLEGLLLVRHKLPPRAAIGIAVELCEALDSVHATGILHRDLKPSNVFLAIDGRGKEVVKIVDFGIAALEGATTPPPGDRGTNKLTRPGTLLGTPEYMPSEQLMGRGLDERSDVYAVGVILFEMLTGVVPFAGTFPEVLLAVQTSPAPPSVRDHRPEISVELAEVVTRALSRAPDGRYPSMEAFAQALQRVRSLWMADSAAPGSGATSASAGEPAPVGSSARGSSIASTLAEVRRRFVRRAFAAPVTVYWQDQTFSGRSEDVSEGGMLVVLDALCPDGANVEIELALPGGGALVRLLAVARWTKTSRRGGGAMGIELVAPPAGVIELIRAYVLAGRVKPSQHEPGPRSEA